jgi:predicted nucleotide-binding protein
MGQYGGKAYRGRDVAVKRDRSSLLAEIESIIETMPPRATIRHHDNQDNTNWFGRVSAVIEKWNPAKSALAQQHISLFFGNVHAREAATGLTSLIILLNQAKAELQLETKGLQGDGIRMNKKVFIGHGRSGVWYQLKSFLTDRLHLGCDEFNAESAAGLSTTARLQAMLDEAEFAFLVMTAEDTHADNSAHARENVIHEAGLFQGRLGFERAIILLEEGCAQFSNIHGLAHISFPKGNLEPAFERIRQVLEREQVGRSVIVDTASKSVFAAELCPKCSKAGWHIGSSASDSVFGVLGVSKRIYKCDFCGFSESKLAK